MKCEICNKEKEDVRFEGSEEMNICDRCLQEKKTENKTKTYNCVLNFEREIEADSEEEAYDKFAWKIAEIIDYCDYISIEEQNE